MILPPFPTVADNSFLVFFFFFNLICVPTLHQSGLSWHPVNSCTRTESQNCWRKKGQGRVQGPLLAQPRGWGEGTHLRVLLSVSEVAAQRFQGLALSWLTPQRRKRVFQTHGDGCSKGSTCLRLLPPGASALSRVLCSSQPHPFLPQTPRCHCQQQKGVCLCRCFQPETARDRCASCCSYARW